MEEFLEIARDNREKHLKYGVSLNPFSTVSARQSWQNGYDGKPQSDYDYARPYWVGVAAKQIADNESR